MGKATDRSALAFVIAPDGLHALTPSEREEIDALSLAERLALSRRLQEEYQASALMFAFTATTDIGSARIDDERHSVIIATWNDRDQFNSDYYHDVPEFDMAPTPGNIHEFRHPILGHFYVLDQLRTLVRINRTLARRVFSSLLELRIAAVGGIKRLNSRAPLDERQRVALLYQWASESLRIFDNCSEEKTAFSLLATASALISQWAFEGSEVAFKKLEERANAARSSARLPRPGGQNLLKKAILQLMRGHRRQGHQFKAFMKSWEANGTLKGLTIQQVARGRFSVESEDENLDSSSYTQKSLETMYSKSSD